MSDTTVSTVQSSVADQIVDDLAATVIDRFIDGLEYVDYDDDDDDPDDYGVLIVVSDDGQVLHDLLNDVSEIYGLSGAVVRL